MAPRFEQFIFYVAHLKILAKVFLITMRIYELLGILRDQPHPETAWAAMLTLLEQDARTDLWSNLPRPRLEADILHFREWLDSCLSAVEAPTGVYLGLDTLNMDNGSGKNVDIGWTACDTTVDHFDWIYGDLNYGSPMMLSGLYELHRIYSLPQWEADLSVADYMLFLGYSGLVARQAILRLRASAPMLFAWGFHDGDMFLLARANKGRTEILCK